MKRLPLAFLACLLLSGSADAWWQSRDSNYNASVSGGGGSGSLSGTYSNLGAGPTAINLTTLTSGGTDYVALGQFTVPQACSKTTGGGAIGLVTATGSGGGSGADAQGWTWSTTDAESQPGSGASCTATNTSINGGYYFGGAAAYGWTFTVPAGTSSQILTVYAGNDTDTLNITATLSDASASPYTNSSCSAAGWIGCKYVITYNAASNGQTLTVKGITTGTGYIGIAAVTLVP